MKKNYKKMKQSLETKKVKRTKMVYHMLRGKVTMIHLIAGQIKK